MILPDGIRKWNELSLQQRQESSIGSFKNQLSVSSACNPLFYGKDRKYNVIHAQFRMKCSNLKSHLYDHKVADDPFCVCSINVEDCDHFFFHCYLYIVQRQDFINQVKEICNNIDVTTDILLFGSDSLTEDENRKIFSLVENFIQESDRFPV